MPRFSDQIVEEIRARTDIVDLISQRVPLKRAGSDFKACCPFHHEKTPSFMVSPSRRSFHCFGCGVQGDVFKFIMLSDGMTFPEAVKALADKCGITLETTDDPQAAHRKTLVKIHNDLAGFYQRCLAGIAEAAHARAYLAKRKLDAKTIEQFRIGYAPTRKDVLLEWAGKNKYRVEDLVEAGLLGAPRPDHPGEGYYDKFKGRLMFPICDQGGQVVGFSGRILTDDKHAPKYYNSPETPIFRKSRVLYGLSFAKRNITRAPRREALVCEGQIDVIRCHACGFGTAVASQGTAFTEEHVALLKAYADCALLVFDGDSAGLKAATRTGRLFLAAGMPVNVALLPEGEDPDSILRDKGAEAFQAILDNHVSLVAFQIRAMRANEKAPDAADVVSRITQEVFDTLAACSKAVMRSCLAREAAEILGVPLEALEADFAAFFEDVEKRRQWQEKLQGRAPADTPREQKQTPQAPRGPAAVRDNGREPEPGPPGDAAPFGEEPAAPAAPPKPKTYRFAETALLSLAELLVKTSTTPTDDNRAIAEFVEQWLPEVARGEGVLKNVVDAALADWRDGSDKLAALASGGSDEERALVDYLSRRRSPIFATEMPMADVVKELVARAWIDFMKLSRDNTDPSTPDGQMRRLRLSSAVRKLESDTSWEVRSGLLSQLL